MAPAASAVLMRAMITSGRPGGQPRSRPHRYIALMTSVLFVHGLWHGAGCWDAVRELLAAAGVASGAVELPMTSLADDVAVARAALDQLEAPVVLVGHSYGGAVVTAAGAHPAVRRLVYLAAFQLAEGESVNSAAPEHGIAPTRLGEALRFSADGAWSSLDPALGAELLYNGVPPALAAAAVAALRPAHRDVFGGVPDTIAWRSVPSTYAVCADDLTVAPDLQRAMAERATDVLEWPTGHSPMLSRPDLVADLVAADARRLG